MPTKVDAEKCTGCEECIEVCPTECIKIEEEKAIIDQDECVDCGACEDACESDALIVD